jgi:hypothetical protein
VFILKERNNYIPGPTKALYGLYMGLLAAVLYSGFYLLHPFSSGWRYPWAMGFMRIANFHLMWILALVAVAYLYYATLGRPKYWKEPLGLFRALIALTTVWFFLLTYAVYRPWGWLQGFVTWLGGPAKAFVWYETFLWVMLILTMLYVYVRWTRSARYPHLRELPAGEGV